MNLDIHTVSDLVTKYLPILDFGFSENARNDSMVIYNSQWCRVKFYINVDRHNKYLEIYYGRLHALDNDWIMKWNGEDCYCWHDNNSDLKLILQFLDGFSPNEAYKTKEERLNLLQEFDSSTLAKDLSGRTEEKMLLRTSTVWRHYGVRLFEVFDLRRPEMWEKYINFLIEYHKLVDEELDAGFKRKGLKRNPVSIPGYKRC